MCVLHKAATAWNSPEALHNMFKGKCGRSTCRLAMPSTCGLPVPCFTREGTRLHSFHTGWDNITFVCAIGKQQPTRNACDSTADRTFPRSIARAPASSKRMTGIIDRHRGIWMRVPLSPIPLTGPEWVRRDDGLSISPGVPPLMGMESIKTNLRLPLTLR